MTVRLLQWNANGILAHCQEFQQSLATHNFDIICIQESFLKPDKDYCPTGYNSVQSDRPTAKGGLITFIRNGLIYTEARRRTWNARPSTSERRWERSLSSTSTYHRYTTRTSSVRRSIPAEQHRHSRRHECQKPTMGEQHKRRQRKSAGRCNYRARICRPQHRSRDISDISRINDAY